MNAKRLALSALIGLSATGAQAEQKTWAFDVQTGSAHNFRVPLTIDQGAYHAEIWADYGTHPFGAGAAPYFDLRLRRWFGAGKSYFISFELLHHKLVLENRPAEVETFRMTFGYNMLFISVGRDITPWLRGYTGLAPILAHPINTVNGKSLPDQPARWPTDKRYDFVGAGIQVGIEGHYDFAENFFINADLKFTTSYAGSIPVVDGNAKSYQASLHFQAGVGTQW